MKYLLTLVLGLLVSVGCQDGAATLFFIDTPASTPPNTPTQEWASSHLPSDCPENRPCVEEVETYVRPPNVVMMKWCADCLVGACQLEPRCSYQGTPPSKFTSTKWFHDGRNWVILSHYGPVGIMRVYLIDDDYE